jgi:hypothetical protein
VSDARGPGAPGGLGGLLAGWRPALRWLFAAYALALFTATHWPALTLTVPGVERPDLFIHFGAFGGWALGLWLSGLAGGPDRWRTVAAAGLASVVYAGVDEGLQAIPALRRTCAWDDFAANCGGVAIGCAVAAGLTMIVRGSATPRQPGNT